MQRMSIELVRRSMVLTALILIGVVPGAFSATTEDYKFKVDPGKHERVMTPITITVRPGPAGWKSNPENFSVVVTQKGTNAKSPAQYISKVGVAAAWSPVSEATLCWIQPKLAANEIAEFNLEISDSEQPKFRWTAEDGNGAKLEWNKRPILEYVSVRHDSKHHEETKKPYHHIFDPANGNIITKGLGGLYPHHRGIYFGYNKCEVDGKIFDTWHCNKNEFEQHTESLASWAGPVCGGHRSRIDWNDPNGKSFAQEIREVNVLTQDSQSMLVDFTTTVTAGEKPVKLGGDRRHCGVHFRAAQTVADNQKSTRFTRPEKWADVPADKELPDKRIHNLPWNAMSFPIEGKTVTVVYLRSNKNPPNPQFDERLYGRFGEFVPYNLDAGKSITLRYRFWIVSGEAPSRNEIEMRARDFNEPPVVHMNN